MYGNRSATLQARVEVAIQARDRGFWVVPLYPPGSTRPSKKERSKGKAPIGKDWGLTRNTPAELRKAFRRWPNANFGYGLGPDRAPGGGWLIDLEGDGDQAEGSLLRLLGDELVETYGWSATRGSHALFTADGERLLELLAAAGATERKEP
jgi:hypothetical protein